MAQLPWKSVFHLKNDVLDDDIESRVVPVGKKKVENSIHWKNM